MKPIHLMLIASVVIVFAGGFFFGTRLQTTDANARLVKRFMDLCAMQIYPAPFTRQQCEQRARYVFDAQG